MDEFFDHLWSSMFLGVATLMSLLGLALTVRALYWDQWRRRGQLTRRCPSCWYEMKGVPGLRCPECGRSQRSEEHLTRPRRRKALASVGVMMMSIAPLLFVARYGVHRGWQYVLLPKYKVTAEDRSHGLVIQWLEVRDPAADWDRLVRIRKGGNVVFELHAPYVSADWWPKVTTLPGTKSPDGDVPNLVLTSESGGTGCYADHYVFGVEPSGDLKPLAVLPYCGRFQDLDGDGVPEFVAGDRTFAYWVTSGGDSPYPDVIMRYRDFGYEPSLDLMRKPAPSEAELMQRIAAFRNHGDRWEEQFAAVLEVTLDLIYSGHEDRAWTFMRDHWPSNDEPNGKHHDEFEKELRQMLTASPFWPVIIALNQPADISEDTPAPVTAHHASLIESPGRN